MGTPCIIVWACGRDVLCMASEGNASNGSTHSRPELHSIFNERTQGTCVDKSYSFKDMTSSAGLSVKVADGTCEEAFSLQSRNTAAAGD